MMLIKMFSFCSGLTFISMALCLEVDIIYVLRPDDVCFSSTCTLCYLERLWESSYDSEKGKEINQTVCKCLHWIIHNK